MEYLLIAIMLLFLLMVFVPLIGILWLEKKIVDVQWERIQNKLRGFIHP